MAPGAKDSKSDLLRKMQALSKKVRVKTPNFHATDSEKDKALARAEEHEILAEVVDRLHVADVEFATPVDGEPAVRNG